MVTKQMTAIDVAVPPKNESVRLNRVLGLWGLIFIGMVLIQPTSPMGIYGVISNKAHGHVVSAILIAMIGMLFTAISYGRLARVYPSAGSAYTYVGQEMHSTLGYIVGWCIVMDYILNVLICTAFSAKAAMNIFPSLPYYLGILVVATFFTWVNLHAIKTSAKLNEVMCIGMTIVVFIFLASVARSVWRIHHDPGFFTRPFYDPSTFNFGSVLAGTSVAVLTLIGFDAVSTLSEEVRNPRRNIMLATILLCLITGVLSALEVYAAQLIWGSKPFPASQVESAFAIVSGQTGGVLLFQIVNVTLLVANMGSGMGAQLVAGRLLYGMGRGNALPRSFFGAIEPKHRVPRNNILLVGALALFGAGILESLAGILGGGAYEIGAQALNFGALISFMGVNAACFAYQLRQGKNGGLTRILGLSPPALGFFTCAFMWVHLSRTALLLGTAWMITGLVWGALRTRGFRAESVSFDVPPDEA